MQKRERVRRLITDYFDTRTPRGWDPNGGGRIKMSEEVLAKRLALVQYFRDTNYASAGKPSRP